MVSRIINREKESRGRVLTKSRRRWKVETEAVVKERDQEEREAEEL